MNYYITVFVTTIVLTLVIAYYAHRKNMLLSGQKVFFFIPVSLLLVATFNFLTWVFDGKTFPGAHVLNVIFTFGYYITQGLVPLLWTLFVGSRYLDDNQYKRTRLLVFLPLLLIFAVCIISLFNGCIFYFDENNVYHKGTYLAVVSIALFTYLFISTLIIIAKRRRIKREEIFSYMFFPVIPTICSIIQLIIYGLDIITLGMTVSVMIVLISILKESMMIDYLTKLNNRRQLQDYLEYTISKKQSRIKQEYVVGVMLDLIKFKDINDTYGHAIGDVALEDASTIIRKSFSKNDFLSRYAGDEFVIIVLTNDINDYVKISENIKKIEKEFNDTSNRAYKLNFSIGSVIFDLKEKFVPSAFLEKIDKAMYEDKRNRKVGN